MVPLYSFSTFGVTSASSKPTQPTIHALVIPRYRLTWETRNPCPSNFYFTSAGVDVRAEARNEEHDVALVKADRGVVPPFGRHVRQVVVPDVPLR